MNLASVRLIAKKEWEETFNSPMPYIFLTVFFLLTGWLFVASMFLIGQASTEEFFATLPLMLIFFMPAFTMRLFAEEYKSGTMELLATLPLRDWEIVAGKFVAALLMWATALGLSLFYVVLLRALGAPDVGQTLSGFFGALLLGGLYAAAGLFASSLTRSQVVGFLLGFLTCFALFLVGRSADYLPGAAGTLMTFLGVDTHFEPFLRGVVDTRDVLYFLSGQALFLAGTLGSVHSRRWR